MDTQTTPTQPESGNYKGKLLKILVFDGDLEAPAVCVALPLSLVKLAGRLLPPSAKLIPLMVDLAISKKSKNKEFEGSAQQIREKYADFDFAEVFTTICEVIEEGIDELEDIGTFDFVSVLDGNEGVTIRIE